jgi:hypothetical protein
VLHTWLAVMQGYDYSQTLYAVAHGITPQRGVIPREEARVLAFQGYLHAGLDNDALCMLMPLHLPTLAQAARVLLAPLGE